MRLLLLLRGAPGCGKSTFINKNGLKPYTLSADDIRLQCQSAQQLPDGGLTISQNNEKTVWNMLFKLLEVRMQNGEFTVIDATNSKTSEMNRYKEMCDTYRYRIFCIDFTDLPIEECKRRNAERTSLKQVPEDVIDKMYSRFKNQKIPSGIKVLKPSEIDQIWMKKIDLSSYNKIVHIGDIHGCYTALMEYFKNGLRDDTMYIFVGDFIDRGIENAKVVNWLISILDKKNVLFLEGNHERWLWIYAHGGVGHSKEFELYTRKELDEAHIDPKKIRQLYRRLGQCAWYQYQDKEVFVSHAGIATMPDNLSKMATIQMIKGVGSYNDFEMIADTWMNTTPSNCYQIHGHRNTKNVDMRVRDRVFNLEGKVEFGGDLRIVELDKKGFHEILIKNTVYNNPLMISQKEEITKSSVADIVIKLRGNKYINEKKFENISSFNFSKNAFYDKVWNEQTIKARGLYIDTADMTVAARSYDKFFNINERPETKFDMLQYSLKFPVTCYVKENGFLGMISYDKTNDDLFISTKSSIEGDYVTWLREIITQTISDDNKKALIKYCKDNHCTFVVECIDPIHDPHIIEYSKPDIVLLSIVSNNMNFHQVEYSELCNTAAKFGLNVKKKAYEIATWSDFFDWYNEVLDKDYTYEGKTIEGFVIEDSKGFMTKLKLTYYNFWKYMRSVAYETLKKGYITKTGSLTTAEANDFYAFCQNLYQNKEFDNQRMDIISLRKMYKLTINDI